MHEGPLVAQPSDAIGHDPDDAAHRRAREKQSQLAPAEARALGAIALLSLGAILWVVAPVGTGVLLGTVFAFATYPICSGLSRRTHKPRLVAALVTVLTTLALAGTLGLLAFLLVQQGVAFFGRLPPALAPGGAADAIMAHLAGPLRALHLQPSSVADRVSGALGSAASYAAGLATQVASAVFDGVIALIFMATTMYFVLRRWSALGRLAERMMPINPHHTRRLMREIRRLGHAVILGNFGTGIVQGMFAWIGFAIARVPQAGLLGALTAAASLIPAIGTLLVWVPAGLVLLAVGHTGAGAFLLVWGALVVGSFCDYVVRPRLVGGSQSMSSWMALVALFGGIKVFGFVGILLGPMVVGIAFEALRIYERTRRFRLGLH
jgi:predicted PurR-regulated permease PerM